MVTAEQSAHAAPAWDSRTFVGGTWRRDPRSADGCPELISTPVLRVSDQPPSSKVAVGLKVGNATGYIYDASSGASRTWVELAISTIRQRDDLYVLRDRNDRMEGRQARLAASSGRSSHSLATLRWSDIYYHGGWLLPLSCEYFRHITFLSCTSVHWSRVDARGFIICHSFAVGRLPLFTRHRVAPLDIRHISMPRHVFLSHFSEAKVALRVSQIFPETESAPIYTKTRVCGPISVPIF